MAAAFDFPNSPSNGQIYAPSGGPRYQWSGATWDVVAPEIDPGSDVSDAFWATRAAMLIDIAGGLSPIYDGKVYSAGGYQYVGKVGATAIPDLPGLLPQGDATPQHFGAVGDGAANDTTAMQAAFNSGFNLFVPVGDYKLTDMVSLRNQRAVQGANRARAKFMIHSDFNMAALGVIQINGGESNASIRDLGVEFEQPSFVGMTRADLIHYPPAIYGLSVGRVMIDNFRVTCGWDGLTLPGNSGGIDIGTLEVGCFNRGLFMDGALDWVLIHTYRFWAYGIPGTGTPQGDIFRDGTTIACEFGRVDGLVITNACIFRGNFVMRTAATGGVDFHVHSLMLDSAAQLLMEGGELYVAGGYSTNGPDAKHSAIVVNNSEAYLHLQDFKLVWSTALHDAVVQTQGKIIWKGGRFVSYAPGNRAWMQSGGRMVLKDVELGSYSTTRTVPFIEANSGYVDISENYVDETVTGNPEMIKIGTDGDMVKVQNNRLMSSVVTIPTGANLGVYGPNGISYAWTPTLVFDVMGDAAPTYSDQLGRYWWDSNGYFYEVRMVCTMNAYTTASGFAYIIGLPSLGRGISGMGAAISNWNGIDLNTGFTQVLAGYSTNTTQHPCGRISLAQAGDNVVSAGLTVGNIKPSTVGVTFILQGYVRTRI